MPAWVSIIRFVSQKQLLVDRTYLTPLRCDGAHSICFNCKKRDLDCSFLLLAPSSRLSTIATSPEQTTEDSETHAPATPRTPYQIQVFRASPPSSPSSTPKSPISSKPASASPTETDVQPLKLYPSIRFDVWKRCREQLPVSLQFLLDHYEVSTALTLATDDPAKYAWQAYIPELVYNHGFLIHNVLSIASLHLGSLYKNKDKKFRMRIMADNQINRALTEFRPRLEDVSEKNATALFACATMTALYYFRTSALDIEETLASVPLNSIAPPSEIVDRVLRSIISVFWGLRGTLVILNPGWEWITGSKLSPMCTRPWWPQSRFPAGDRAMEEDRRLCKLESLWIRPGQDYESHFDMLSESLHYLRDTFALTSQLTVPGTGHPSGNIVSYSSDDTTVGLLRDRGAIFLWPVRISRGMISLIQQKNREALVLVAHYAILLGRVRNVWWLDGLGSAMMMAVACALSREDWYLIQWPAKVVGIDLDASIPQQSPKEEGKVVIPMPL
ncbi:hypothetical protein CC78DRAFT_616746 [Lojkania enalia]|uniref:Zn(2)-C6 fungal-type domain-containing protein n=1 Tax=Lojkania enalia TaxID=147567 RepID=A0A9P4KDR5_9PLEO|nr:hypothetical protein CC78DRAFT_616746 [Didymosphaeria enalia]